MEDLLARDHLMLFVGGLHRSGTTPLMDALRERPEISVAERTGVPKDEGQFLQNVYPPALVYGGPGKFAFRPEAHLTEKSPLATPDNAAKMKRQWARFWDLRRPILLEKSPPNLIKSRFLRALFPNSKQLVVVRHPIATSLATEKWSQTNFESLIEHWIVSHQLLKADIEGFDDVRVISYENLVTDPEVEFKAIFKFIGLEPRPVNFEFKKEPNERYFQTYRERLASGSLNQQDFVQSYEERISELGYSFVDLNRSEPDLAIAPTSRSSTHSQGR